MKLYVHRVKKRGVNSLSRRSSRAEADSACDVEDEFANVSTGFHQPMRFGCLAERKRIVNDGRNHAPFEQRPDVVAQVASDDALLGRRAGPQR